MWLRFLLLEGRMKDETAVSASSFWFFTTPRN